MKEQLVKTVRMDRNGMIRNFLCFCEKIVLNMRARGTISDEIWNKLANTIHHTLFTWFPINCSCFAVLKDSWSHKTKWRNRSARRQIGITENKLYLWMKERRSGSTIHNISKVTAIKVCTGMWVTRSILKRVGGHRRARDLITLNVTL